jgi:hypothetical protein
MAMAIERDGAGYDPGNKVAAKSRSGTTFVQLLEGAKAVNVRSLPEATSAPAI